jgi:CheY-like chemotaxis protein
MVVDFLMPDATGAGFLWSCRQDHDLASIPALVMSGVSAGELRDQGVETFLRKPFHPDELVALLSRLL